MVNENLTIIYLGVFMKISPKLLMLIFLIITTSAFSEKRIKKEKHFVALREIDRPLNLGQRQKRISAGYMALGTYNKDTHKKEFYPVHVTADEPNYVLPKMEIGISDSFSITINGFLPSVQYLFLNRTKVENGHSYINGPNMAFIGGLSSLLYSQSFNNKVYIGVTCGLLGKFPINKRIWISNRAQIYAGNTSVIYGEGDLGIGFQLSDRASIIPKFTLGLNVYTLSKTTSYYSQFQNTFKFNISDHLGLKIFGKLYDNYFNTDENLIEVAGGIGIHFSW